MKTEELHRLLVAQIEREYPGAHHFENFWVASFKSDDPNEPEVAALLMPDTWTVPGYDEPSPELVQQWVQELSAEGS